MANHPLVSAVWLLLELGVASALGLALYRIYFHPLRQFPGPKHYAVTGFAGAIESHFKGTFTRKILRFHEKYGDIVRTGPNTLSINGNIGWPEVFGHTRGGRPEFGRWEDFYQVGNKDVQTIFSVDRENHRRQRRLLAHAFSEQAIRGHEVLVNKYVDKLFAHLKKESVQGQATDMVKWYNLTTFDIIGDLMFGESFDCLDNKDYHPFVETIFDGVRAAAAMIALMRMPLLRWTLPLIVAKKDIDKHYERMAMSKEKAERRIALGPAPGGRKDIMTYAFHNNDDEGMSRTEMISNADAFILAGSETTATALSGLTYYITTNPQALKMVQDEVRAAFSTEDEITIASTAQLKYLHACLEEALRLYPPVVETPPRISPGEYVDGKYIPEGTFITMHQWAIHHNPSNFAQPNAFRPERWLGPDHPLYDPQFSADKKVAFQPFSFGPRNCIGKNLAYAEMKLVASRLFWNFDFELDAQSNTWPDNQRVFIFWEKLPLMVKLRKVERN